MRSISTRKPVGFARLGANIVFNVFGLLGIESG